MAILRHPGFPREEVKLGLNIAYNAKTLCGAKSALALKLAERAGRDVVTKSDHARAAQIITASCEKHSAIARAFGSDNGVDIQFRDSEIIREVLTNCRREGIPALPVHDEVIAPERHESRVAEIMTHTFEEREPGPNRAKLKIHRLTRGETQVVRTFLKKENKNSTMCYRIKRAFQTAEKG